MGGKNNSAANAEQTALNNQQGINNQLSQYANQTAQQNSQYYQAPLAATSQGYSGAASAISPLLGSNYTTALSSGGNLQGQTGINVNQLGQNLTGYASNTGATNLAQQNPALTGFYQNEMQNGINPQYAANAQSQIQQNGAQQLADARSHMAPGQNMNGVTRDIQNQTLANSVNVAGNLAGQSQTFANQGAQGVGTTANSLDTQTLSMLQAALGGGQSVNQNAITNLLNTLNAGQTGLNNTTSFLGQGGSQLNNAENSLAGIAQQNASQAAQFGQQAQQQQGSGGLLGGILGTVGNLATGGLAGSLTSGLGGLFGGGGGSGADSSNSSFGTW